MVEIRDLDKFLRNKDRQPEHGSGGGVVVIVGIAASVVLVIATVLAVYETLRLTSDHLAELPIPPRARIIVVVLAAFVGHTLAVWIYAFAYWLLAVQWQVGGFAGLPVDEFEDCLYFSVVTYTSLGFGDHIPVSHMRLISGVEALNGLLMIGWSVSYTYLAMERYWPLHGGQEKSGGRTNRSEASEPPSGRDALERRRSTRDA